MSLFTLFTAFHPRFHPLSPIRIKHLDREGEKSEMISPILFFSFSGLVKNLKHQIAGDPFTLFTLSSNPLITNGLLG